MADTLHKNIRVHGNVQDVFFRANTAVVARKHKLTGFVRNEPDGTVYLEVEGQSEALQQMVTWCHSGPAGAQVAKCDVSDGPVEHYTSFEVRR
ncbi:MAG: acylphosphatase [Parcubacteria group bacterium]